MQDALTQKAGQCNP